MVFQSGCANVYTLQQELRTPLDPHPCQHSIVSVLFCFVDVAIFMGVWWYLMVLIGIYLIMMLHYCSHAYVDIFLYDISIQVFCPCFHYVVSPFLIGL